MEHVTEQLNRGPELISDLDKRGLYIVEFAERRYGQILKWDPLHLSGLLQEEAYHMKRLAEPMEGAALKVKHWLRKERRQADFFGRKDAPETKFLLPANAVRDIDRLGDLDRQAQIDRLLGVDSMPNAGLGGRAPEAPTPPRTTVSRLGTRTPASRFGTRSSDTIPPSSI